jgi:hypothetical protein
MMAAPIRHITIIGAPLLCSLAAAMMSARLPGGACKLDIIQSGEDVSGFVYSRPNIRHVHQLLQITEDELRRKAGAEMIMALPYTPRGGDMFYAPLGDYGRARSGCDFQHYWHRAYTAGQAKDIAHYNLALRLNSAGIALGAAPKDLPSIDPAYRFDTAKYTALLGDIAQAAAPLTLHSGDNIDMSIADNMRREIRLSGHALHSDLIIDLRADVRASIWTENYVAVQTKSAGLNQLSGVTLFVVQSAIERLFSLWPDTSYGAAECREYNRLAAEEGAHINDMASLISAGFKAEDISVRLARKIKLFRSRGRLSFEDYDIFSKAEWMSALRAGGINQAGYDRLADRERLSDIQHWLAEISQKIDAQMNALKGNM